MEIKELEEDNSNIQFLKAEFSNQSIAIAQPAAIISNSCWQVSTIAPCACNEEMLLQFGIPAEAIKLSSSDAEVKQLVLKHYNGCDGTKDPVGLKVAGCYLIRKSSKANHVVFASKNLEKGDQNVLMCTGMEAGRLIMRKCPSIFHAQLAGTYNKKELLDQVNLPNAVPATGYFNK